MWWIVWALAAHLGNALVFVADKSLLKSRTVISDPLRYAAYSGAVAGLASVLLFFSPLRPSVFLIAWSLLGGIFWVLGLWLFFSGLKHGEPSRVVPIAGSAVPVFTLFLAAVFLGERFEGRQLIGIAGLIAGGIFLSMSWKAVRGLSRQALSAAVLSGLGFAAAFVVTKYMYSRLSPFLPVFAYSRMGVGAVAVGLLAVLATRGRRENAVANRRRPVRTGGSARFAWAVFAASKSIGMGALILQNYAISLASVTLVAALQGVQYLFVLSLSAGLARWQPSLGQENLEAAALGQKLLGIALIGGSLWMIV